MKRVLILGGHGFIGSQIRLLFEQQAELLTLTGPRSRALNLVTASESAWDDLLRSARPDVIVNAAGRTTGPASSLSAANVLLVSQLLASLERLSLVPWLIHLGSAAEYGVTPPDRPVTEETDCHPVSDYGLSKLNGTRLVQRALSLHRARGLILRVFNPVGAGQTESTLPGRAARLLRAAVAERKSEVVFGSLSASRDYLDVRDVARAALTAARLDDGRLPGSPPEVLPEILNVGYGRARSSRELVEGLALLAGFAGRIGEEAQGSPRSELPWQQADVGRLRALGWTPHFTLQDALTDLWNGLPPAVPPPDVLSPGLPLTPVPAVTAPTFSAVGTPAASGSTRLKELTHENARH